MNVSPRTIIAGLAGLALAGTVGVGMASADPTASPSPSPSPSSSASAAPSDKPGKADKPSTAEKADRKAKKADKKQRPLAARALHGEVTLAGKKHRVVDFQRGTVEKVSATSLTVRSKDGFTATYVLDATTKVRAEKKAGTLADVETADRVRVVATKDGSTLTAQRIADRGPR